MPHGHFHRQAANESEVYSALVSATRGYGALGRFVERHGLCYKFVQGMLYGNRRVSAGVAQALGYELRWVRIEKGERQSGTGSGIQQH